MKKYFLHNGTEQQGPFDLDELKTKHIKKDTPIWYDGIPDWTAAENIEELKEILKTSTPPPFTTKQPTPPPINTYPSQQESNSTKSKPKKKRKAVRIILILFIVLVAIGGVFFVIGNMNNSSRDDGSSYQEKVMTVEEIERSQPTSFLSASGTYEENFWGTKFTIQCEITNKATVATYKDAVIRVTYYSKTKTALNSKEYTIYETFPPTSTKTVELKIDNFENVDSLGWEVVSATSY